MTVRLETPRNEESTGEPPSGVFPYEGDRTGTVPIFSRLWHQLGAIGTASGWASLSS